MKIGSPTIDSPWDRRGFVDEGFDYFINAFGQPVDDLFYHCPCCDYPTIQSRGSFAVCPVCNWEDDGQDCHDADRVRGGPNGSLSLTAARANFVTMGACEDMAADRIRAPTDDETRWKKRND